MRASRLSRDDPPDRRAPVAIERLRREHGVAPDGPPRRAAFAVLIATILSAQATDAKVDEIAERLFARYHGPEDFLAVGHAELAEQIRDVGLFRQKARSILGTCEALVSRHGGAVPMSMAELTALPGVGRKTANIVLSAAGPRDLPEQDAGIAVDTHVARLARRLALTRQRHPERIERDLTALIARDRWPAVNLTLVRHGRHTCRARRPRCGDCVVERICPSSLAAGRSDLAGQAVGIG